MPPRLIPEMSSFVHRCRSWSPDRACRAVAHSSAAAASPFRGGQAVSRSPRSSFRQLLSCGASAAVVVVLANCADAPTATSAKAPEAPSLARASTQLDDAVVPGEIIVGLNDDTDAPALAQTHGLGLGRQG